jgi:hypothetical protein
MFKEKSTVPIVGLFGVKLLGQLGAMVEFFVS